MRSPPLILAMLLVACSQSPAENSAEQLENAAAQSDPAAAGALENAAEALRDSDPANPQPEVQNALQAAGNAQVQP
jgi:hypothetical protein